MDIQSECIICQSMVHVQCLLHQTAGRGIRDVIQKESITMSHSQQWFYVTIPMSDTQELCLLYPGLLMG